MSKLIVSIVIADILATTAIAVAGYAYARRHRLADLKMPFGIKVAR